MDFNSKQAARNKHLASQSKKRRNQTRKPGKGKQKRDFTPQDSTLDEFISVPEGYHDNRSIEQMVLMDSEVNPQTKDFGYLIGLFVLLTTLIFIYLFCFIENATKKSFKEFETFEDGSGNLDYITILSTCIGSLPLSMRLLLDSEEDYPIIKSFKEDAFDNSISKEDDIVIDESNLIINIKPQPPTIIQPETKSELVNEEKNIVVDKIPEEPSDDLLDDLLEDMEEDDKEVSSTTVTSNLPSSTNNQTKTTEVIKEESDEELEDWLDSVL